MPKVGDLRWIGLRNLLLAVWVGLLAAPSAQGQISATWMGTISSDWDNPANWFGGVVPGPLDTVRLNGGGPMIVGTRTVGGLNIITGTVQGGGRLVVTGSATWSAGAIAGGTTLEIAPGATMSITSAGTHNIFGTLLNNGTITWSNGSIAFSEGQLVNNGSFVSHQAGSAELEISGSGTGTFTNNGAFLHDSGSVSAQNIQSVRFVNNGSVTVAGGFFSIDGGNQAQAGTYTCTAPGLLGVRYMTLNNAISFAGSGQFEISQCIVNGAVSASGPILMQDVTLNADHVIPGLVTLRPVNGFGMTGSGVVTFAGGLDWRGGPMVGTGETIVPVGATLVFTTECCNGQRLLARTLRTGGTTLMNTGIQTQPSAQWINTGTLNATNQGNSSFGNNGGIFVNSGTININSPMPFAIGNRSNGSNPDLPPTPFINTGTVNIITGGLALDGGGSTTTPLAVPTGVSLIISSDFQFASPVSVTGAGTVVFRGRQCTIAGSVQAVQLTFETNHSEQSQQFLGPVNVGAMLAASGSQRFAAPVTVAGAVTGMDAGSNLTLDAPLSAGSLDATVIAALNVNVDQQWHACILGASVSGPGDITLTGAGNVLTTGSSNGPGKTRIASGATVEIRGVRTAHRDIINSGTVLWYSSLSSMSGCSFENHGLVRSMAPATSTMSGGGPGASFLNDVDGILELTASSGVSFTTAAGPMPFINRGTLRRAGGSALYLRGGGESTVAWTRMDASTFATEVASEFRFVVPVLAAQPEPLTVSGGTAIFESTPGVGPITCTGGGGVKFNVDATIPELRLTNGNVQGPGNVLVQNVFSWSIGDVREGGTLTAAPSCVTTIESSTAHTLRRQLVLGGTSTWAGGSIDVSGGTLINDGVLTSTAPQAHFVQATTLPGTFMNRGTLIKTGAGSLEFRATPQVVTFTNTGSLVLRGGTTLITGMTNLASGGQTLSGGVWSLENAATLAVTSADIRSIGAGTTVSLLSTSSASFPALANLTTNSGTLVLGPGRTQNINPVGGTFTNSGELSLRAGSLFNVVGNFIQTAIGTLRTQIGGPLASQIGRLTATGSVTLGGTVITEYANGYTPASCNATLPFISAASVTGTFTNASTATVNGRVSRVVVGASLAALSVRNPADVATIGGLPPGDNTLTADDVIVYLNAFFGGVLGVADIASLGGSLSPDGQLTPDDLVAFLNSFFAGCN